MIWNWVKAPSIKDLDECCAKLLAALDKEEAYSLQSYYQPKEY
jgi:hypothetical protein